MNDAEALNASRKTFSSTLSPAVSDDSAAEGGCGVVGLISTKRIKGRFIDTSLSQMANRGNGKGGGVLAVGLNPAQMGVPAEILKSHYILQVAYLDPKARKDVEVGYILNNFNIFKKHKVESVKDFRRVGSLEVEPPLVWRYFVRVKSDVLKRFVKKNKLSKLSARAAEDEFVYQNSFAINNSFYASLGDKKAFVLSHGRNMFVFKIVGYAEESVRYYRLDDVEAHLWIGHQRYPTKGRVWHPGGAHPFIGMNEALIHNGDFANYYAVTDYLKQNNITTQFLTDTEVSVLLFDLMDRTFGYPLEYIIESLAPTSERDFDMLPKKKQQIYEALHASHIHASPDGPWFFIIGRSKPEQWVAQLIGITDTSMLRPQVFALQEGRDHSILLIASEKQAIDAALADISAEDSDFCPVADMYWNARGGSHTDGGSFIFTVSEKEGKFTLSCTDKFGNKITTPTGQSHYMGVPMCRKTVKPLFTFFDLKKGMRYLSDNLRSWDFEQFIDFLCQVEEFAAKGDDELKAALDILTLILDRRFDTGAKKRSSLISMTQDCLVRVLESIPKKSRYALVSWKSRKSLKRKSKKDGVLVVDCSGFPAEGKDCASQYLVKAYSLGWRNFIIYNMRGQRFIGCGFGFTKDKVTIDVFGSSGDYLASGIYNVEIIVHGSAQDQLCQIMKGGRLIVHGDVGQTFMYGAKGGEVYVLGNAAGRPLINAVGSPKLVINGTCLDYLAESFMAGDPHKGGGFVILNGVYFDEHGLMREHPTPYPGSNLFSLASGGAIYIRDPHRRLDAGQLNGGVFVQLTERDWELIHHYLMENERLFGISVDELLKVNGVRKDPREVYIKVEVAGTIHEVAEEQ